MTTTAQFELPLLQPSQAQKHVTVNEALVRLDAMAALVLVSRSLAVPPPDAAEGSAYGLPSGAAGPWEGQAGRIALWVNGGWEFLTPRRGWRAWISDEGAMALHDGTDWRAGAIAVSASGAAAMFRVLEFDHLIASGVTSTSSVEIPAHSMVFAVTARVTETITGSLTSWSLGNPGAAGRFGTDLGLGSGAYARGLLGTPLSFYTDTPVVFTADGGAFAGGRVRVAVHLFQATVPGV